MAKKKGKKDTEAEAQAADPATDADRDTRKLRKLIKNTRVAMLTTIAGDGMLRSRPMATLKAPFDGQLWFLARTGARMTDEIKDNQKVGLSYASPDDERFVSVTGTATLLRDPEKVRELWNRRMRAWFPEGKSDPDLALIRVAIERADYWDPKRGVMVHLSVPTGSATPERRQQEGPETPAGSGAQA
jgi:general stress protein 26